MAEAPYLIRQLQPGCGNASHHADGDQRYQAIKGKFTNIASQFVELTGQGETLEIRGNKIVRQYEDENADAEFPVCRVNPVQATEQVFHRPKPGRQQLRHGHACKGR